MLLHAIVISVIIKRRYIFFILRVRSFFSIAYQMLSKDHKKGVNVMTSILFYNFAIHTNIIKFKTYSESIFHDILSHK